MTEIKKVVLKQVAAEVGLEEKRLRKLLRDHDFKKAERLWSWAEDHPDLEIIRSKAQEWDKAETTTPAPVPETANPEADPVEAKMDEVTQEPADEAQLDDSTETTNEEETEAQ